MSDEEEEIEETKPPRYQPGMLRPVGEGVLVKLLVTEPLHSHHDAEEDTTTEYFEALVVRQGPGAIFVSSTNPSVTHPMPFNAEVHDRVLVGISHPSNFEREPGLAESVIGPRYRFIDDSQIVAVLT